MQSDTKTLALLEEINCLKNSSSAHLVVNVVEFQLDREKIQHYINRKLNDTDWKVLNLLLKQPWLSNKEIAKEAFLSFDGIGSALKRMYLNFEIKEKKYKQKKTALLIEAILASNK